MKELNLGQVLIENRRKRGITQEELAEHMGVSKTAVSKWETGSTYPDIILLPRLAAFFAISVDQLLDYRPQMEREEIRKLCQTLRRDFAAGPFPEVMDRCRELAKKYFACPELLFQLACLYINHCALAGEQMSAVLKEALALVARVKEESADNFLITQAVNLEGFCLLRLGRPQEALRLLRSAVPLHGDGLREVPALEYPAEQVEVSPEATLIPLPLPTVHEYELHLSPGTEACLFSSQM